jgi:hypothetical protein
VVTDIIQVEGHKKLRSGDVRQTVMAIPATVDRKEWMGGQGCSLLQVEMWSPAGGGNSISRQ